MASWAVTVVWTTAYNNAHNPQIKDLFSWTPPTFIRSFMFGQNTGCPVAPATAEDEFQPAVFPNLNAIVQFDKQGKTINSKILWCLSANVRSIALDQFGLV
ncbi:hypothetical protein HPP92_013631 [Vanilla planifolia]|uniref:Uncharacterized protein n=1 Tax=Vanilla planifolia TaxID=51239 RepID=A0A835QV41_VANPL|nr:hypothetical protein HPP92_013631 [Vanilla planifolia]